MFLVGSKLCDCGSAVSLCFVDVWLVAGVCWPFRPGVICCFFYGFLFSYFIRLIFVLICFLILQGISSLT